MWSWDTREARTLVRGETAPRAQGLLAGPLGWLGWLLAGLFRAVLAGLGWVLGYSYWVGWTDWAGWVCWAGLVLGLELLDSGLGWACWAVLAWLDWLGGWAGWIC